MRQKATPCATLALPPPQPLLDPHEIFPSFLKLGPTFSSRAVTSALTCRAEGSQVYWQSREDIYMKKCHILNSTSFFFIEQITGWVSSFQMVTTISCLTLIHQLYHPAYHNIISGLAFILQRDLTERCQNEHFCIICTHTQDVMHSWDMILNLFTIVHILQYICHLYSYRINSD